MNHSHNYLFISDLHLSEGILPETNKLSRNEDFFYDDAFARFLAYHVALSKDERAPVHYHRKPWRLIINGDIFDFLQVTSLPAEGDELERVMGERLHKDLSSNDRDYGLGTSEAEIVWKVERIAAGHPLFFQALGWFVAHEGCELILLKGNHDVELYWGAVREAMWAQIGKAYQTWWEGCQDGVMPGMALPYGEQGEMPAFLTPAHLQKIQFPAWFYYVPDLLYVEHGNQYDPANAFADFLEPIILDSPDQIELPSGSFFVRYYFNKIEQIHPFADNIKPIAKYARWALTEKPLDSISMIIQQRHLMWKSVLNLIWKQADPIQGRPNLQKPAYQAKKASTFGVPLNPFRWGQLQKIRDKYQETARTLGKQTSWLTAGLVGVSASHGFGLLLSMKHFVEGKWRKMLVSLVGAGTMFAGKTILNQQLNKFDSLVTLTNVAKDICLDFNKPDREGQQAHVRFYIFGHNHDPKVEPIIDSSQNAPSYNQWYVNTGAWLPLFSEEDRLTRGDIQLTFFRLTPTEPNFGEKLPALWEWLPQADRPSRIRMLE
jgi:UDP-2,3-diacylglucosamine pyrophosphatase LpxH